MAQLDKKPAEEFPDGLSADAAHRLVHEMRVHRVELELQNEELRKTQEDLESARARYFDLYDLAPVGYLSLDGKGVIEEANLTGATLLGLSRIELTGKPLTRFIVREDQDVYYLHRKQLLKTGMPQACEARLVRKDGARFWSRIESAVAEGEKGESAQIRCVVSDISDQKRADINERRLESIFRAAPIAIGLVRQRVLMDVNETMCRMTGYARFELVGKNARMLYPTKEEYEFVGKEKYRQVETDGVGCVETRWRRKNGQIRHILLSSAPIDSRDLSQGVTFTALDITERKQAEYALRHQLRTEKFIARLTSRLVGMDAASRKEVVEESLAALGEFFGADRCYLFLFHADGSSFDVHREWCREGAEPQIAALQNVKVADGFPYGFAQLQAQDIWAVSDVDALPPQAGAEKTEFLKEGIRSVLNIPYRKDGRIVYVLGFDHCRESRVWTDDETALIKVVSDLLGQAMEKGELEASLQRQTKELVENNRMFQLAMDTIPVRIFWKDCDLKFLGCNRLFAQDAGRVSPNDMLGRDDYEMSWKDQAEMYRRDDRAVIESGVARYAFEEPQTTPDGRTIWLRTSKAPLRNADDRIIGVLGVYEDITAEKRQEEERRRLEAQIEQTQRLESLGVMAGGIAHDFNNILMAVLGHAEMAMDELPSASPARENIRAVTTAALRAAELCREMLAYAGKASFATESVDLKEVVEEMDQLLSASIPKNVRLRLNLSSELPCVEADPGQIRQVIMNLIINAADAIGEREGVVTVAVKVRHCAAKDFLAMDSLEDLRPGPYLAVEVSDTGEGMDDETRSHIFEPFFTTKFTGRGLGLAAVLGIVRSLRGAIQVHSELGKGTCFTILLPVRMSEAKPLPAPHVGPADDEWKGQGTVLLADDEKPLRLLGTLMFRRMGFEVVAVEDGQEAVEEFCRRRDDVALVFLDLTMPRMGGLQAFEKIREIDTCVRVALVSGYAEEDVLRRLGDVRVAGIVQKPYTFEALRDMVRKVVSVPAAGDESDA